MYSQWHIHFLSLNSDNTGMVLATLYPCRKKQVGVKSADMESSNSVNNKSIWSRIIFNSLHSSAWPGLPRHSKAWLWLKSSHTSKTTEKLLTTFWLSSRRRERLNLINKFQWKTVLIQDFRQIVFQDSLINLFLAWNHIIYHKVSILKGNCHHEKPREGIFTQKSYGKSSKIPSFEAKISKIFWSKWRILTWTLISWRAEVYDEN